MDWIYPVLLVVVAVFLLRLLPGYLFGGTQDQLGYLVLWDQIEQHHNPTRIQTSLHGRHSGG